MDRITEKLREQMKLIHIVDRRPKMKIKLDPIDSEDFSIDVQIVMKWSTDNNGLYKMILENGMAEFICNKEFLTQHYSNLIFSNYQIKTIDQQCLRFNNLKILNLCQNNIQVIQNIPPNCKQLYLDFNQIQDIRAKGQLPIQLLSVSHNVITDQIFKKISKFTTLLRCLNIAHNRISNIRKFVTTVKIINKIKTLISFGNPISMLAIYYQYLTKQIELTFFDGEKYVKPQPKKQQLKEQKKEPPKQQKKDSKKDAKKGAKVEEKIEQAPKIQLPKEQIKKVLTDQDFQKIKLQIKVTNFQNFSGNIFDSALFPQQNLDLKKTQSQYWLKYKLLGEEIELKQNKLSFDTATIQGDETRLNFDVSIHKEISVSYQNLKQFDSGLFIQVWKDEPKMVLDQETFELKPQIKEGQIVIGSNPLGAIFVDFRKLHQQKIKEIKMKYKIFPVGAVKEPLFKDPYANEHALIEKKKADFESKLKLLEDERIKKLEEEQALKAQKKAGGKDAKKAPDKKAAKKEGKEAVATEKKRVQKSDYPLFERNYCCLYDQKMYKAGKQLLCLHLQIK